MPEETPITTHSTERYPVPLLSYGLTRMEAGIFAADATDSFMVSSPSGISIVRDSPQAGESVERKIRRLADQWRKETMLLSSTTEIVSHPAYLKIIGIGVAAVPFILRELLERGGHWFLALRSITEENPVRPEDAGKMKKMAEAWVLWGHQKGYL